MKKTATYKELGEKIERISIYLQNKGVNQGDRVAILCEIGPNRGAAYFAIASIKTVVVPILNDFHPSEIHHILRHSGACARIHQKTAGLLMNVHPAVFLEAALSFPAFLLTDSFLSELFPSYSPDSEITSFLLKLENRPEKYSFSVSSRVLTLPSR